MRITDCDGCVLTGQDSQPITDLIGRKVALPDGWDANNEPNPVIVATITEFYPLPGAGDYITNVIAVADDGSDRIPMTPMMVRSHLIREEFTTPEAFIRDHRRGEAVVLRTKRVCAMSWRVVSVRTTYDNALSDDLFVLSEVDHAWQCDDVVPVRGDSLPFCDDPVFSPAIWSSDEPAASDWPLIEALGVAADFLRGLPDSDIIDGEEMISEETNNEIANILSTIEEAIMIATSESVPADDEPAASEFEPANVIASVGDSLHLTERGRTVLVAHVDQDARIYTCRTIGTKGFTNVKFDEPHEIVANVE